MNEIEDLLGRMKEDADWVRIEYELGYTASLLEEAMEMIRGMQDVLDTMKERE